MATEKLKITFYAEPETVAAYERIPKSQRSAWVNQMIKAGLTAPEPGKGNESSLANLRDYLKETNIQEGGPYCNFKIFLEMALSEFLS